MPISNEISAFSWTKEWILISYWKVLDGLSVMPEHGVVPTKVAH